MQVRRWAHAHWGVRGIRVGVVLAGLLPLAGGESGAAAQEASLPALPAGVAEPRPACADGLERQVRAVLAEPAVARSHWGVAVVGMDGAPILSIDADQMFQPASTAKLFTTAAAMSVLGPEATVTTRLIGRGVFAGAGELRGDLVLVGAGDGNLSGRTLPYAAPQPHRGRAAGEAGAPEVDPLRYLAAMADTVAATGLKVVTGDVLGEDTVWPWEPYAEGWELDDLVWGYGAPVSALSVADNQMRLTVTPGARAGQPAAVELAQAVPYYVVEATVTTAGAGSTAGGVQVERAAGARVLRVYGQIAADAGADAEEVAIADPAEYAAAALKAMLEERGIAVRGRALAQHRSPESAKGFLAESREPIAGWTSNQASPGSARGRVQDGPQETVLAERVSPSLAEDVTVTNKTSQNLHAELLLRRLALRLGGDGSTAGGARVVRQFLVNAGLDKDDFALYDGSGLSTHDLVTPRGEAALLVYAARQLWFRAWKASLPVGGVDGTLLSRFTKAPLAGHVFAKTGTLGEARALAGYVECASGRMVAVSVMDSLHQPGSSADRDAMDRIVAAIAAAN